MQTNRPKLKLNAKMGLVITSILYLVNAGVGTVLAVKENLPSVTFITSGKPALEDFLTGNGTALSPPLYLMSHCGPAPDPGMAAETAGNDWGSRADHSWGAFSASDTCRKTHLPGPSSADR